MRSVTAAILSPLAVAGAACLGCSDDSGEDEDGPRCRTTETTLVELRDVFPARGTTVPNADIVHRFTTVGVDLYFDSLSIVLLASHTAGVPPSLAFTISQSGSDLVYTFTPMAWPNAPGHVALDDGGRYLSPDDGCTIDLPSPLFEYDVSVP